MNLVRQALLSILLATLAVSAARADWTYEYADDFSTDKVQYDSYACSMFWTKDINPLRRSYLYCLGAGAGRGLVFVDYQDESAQLEYRFPADSTQAHKLVRGTLRFDVSFPCNADISQFPPGQLLYWFSPDGLVWTAAQALQAGHHDLAISSPEGACYVRFTGARAMLDNVRVSLSAPAATIRVRQNQTIQQAIDAAGNGDIIEVDSGIYTGPGNWNIEFRGKRITVRSANGPQSTIIDCGTPTVAAGNRRGFYFHQAEGAEAVLSGFTVRGGRAFGTTIPPDPLHWTYGATNSIGGGIYCEFSSPTITNCIIDDCGAELGGGIGCVGGGPTLIGCTVKECIAGGLGASLSGGRGAGIALVGRSIATIVNCTIQGNSGYSNSQGGGIYCYQSIATIAGGTISGNFASGSLQGGGVYCGGDGTDVTLRNCVIARNTADTGVGVSIQRFATALPALAAPGSRCHVSIVNCTIVQNWLFNPSASASAGGVESVSADVTIIGSIVWYNDGTPLVISGAPVSAPVTYSNIQRGYAGTGNINAEPQFVSTSAPDYHLASASPCLDAGDPEASAVEEPAPNGDRINMGAYGGTHQATKGATHSILYVDGTRYRSSSYATIQAAIDKARNGDTVLVWPGVYQEDVTFRGKAITVQSAADAAVIRAPGGYAVSFNMGEKAGSVLANFVIAGCGVGGVFCDGSSPTLRNLTVVNNQAGIVAYGGANPSIVNCIVWQNTSTQLSAWRADFNWQISYSCLGPINPSTPNKAAGNINANPQFADPEDGDYHLKSQWGRYVPLTGTWTLDSVSSPCLDAGDPAEYPRGERMPNGKRINLGAYGNTAFASLSSGPACN